MYAKIVTGVCFNLCAVILFWCCGGADITAQAQTKVEAKAKSGTFESEVTLSIEGEKVIGFNYSGFVSLNKTFHDCDFSAKEGDGASKWTHTNDTTDLTITESGQQVTVQKFGDKFVINFKTSNPNADGECSNVGLPRRFTLVRAGSKSIGRMVMK